MREPTPEGGKPGEVIVDEDLWQGNGNGRWSGFRRLNPTEQPQSPAVRDFIKRPLMVEGEMEELERLEAEDPNP